MADKIRKRPGYREAVAYVADHSADGSAKQSTLARLVADLWGQSVAEVVVSAMQHRARAARARLVKTEG